MRIFKGTLTVFTLAFMLAGCSHSNVIRYVLWSPQKQVPEQMSYDQSFNSLIAMLPKGPVVEGSACGTATTSLAALEEVRRNAFQDAIKKAGPSYDVLIHGTESFSHYPMTVCIANRGTASKDEEYYAAEANPTSKR